MNHIYYMLIYRFLLPVAVQHSIFLMIIMIIIYLIILFLL